MICEIVTSKKYFLNVFFHLLQKSSQGSRIWGVIPTKVELSPLGVRLRKEDGCAVVKVNRSELVKLIAEKAKEVTATAIVTEEGTGVQHNASYKYTVWKHKENFFCFNPSIIRTISQTYSRIIQELFCFPDQGHRFPPDFRRGLLHVCRLPLCLPRLLPSAAGDRPLDPRRGSSAGGREGPPMRKALHQH